VIDVKYFVRLLPLIAAAGLSQAQTGQGTLDDAAQDVEAPPRYTVEVIVFAYAEDVSVGTERFEPKPYTRPVPSEGLEAAADDALDASRPSPEPATAEASRAAYRFAMLPLEQDEFGMQNIYDMLRRLDVYEPLMHVGWTQTAIPEENTPALRLDRLGPVPDGLDGTLKLYLGRFVHLVVDLSLDAESVAAGEERRPSRRFEAPPEEFGDRRSNEGWRDNGLELLYEPVRYRIREDRIMKTGETRYFDHPRFGVIATVMRIEEDDDSATRSLPASR
jgi:hypothetical protein